jgi:hypothetical protein
MTFSQRINRLTLDTHGHQQIVCHASCIVRLENELRLNDLVSSPYD